MEWVNKANVFFVLNLSFIFGIYLGSLFHSPVIWLISLILASASIVVFTIFFRQSFIGKLILLFGVAFLVVVFGIFRSDIAFKHIDEDKSNNFFLYNDQGEIVFRGIVSSDPLIYLDRVKYVISVLPAKGDNSADQLLQGKIFLIHKKYPIYHYGDLLEIKGRLKSPPVYPDFNYQDYLVTKKIYSLVYYPKIKFISSDAFCHFSSQKGLERIFICWQYNFYQNLFNLKNQLRHSLLRIISPPEEAILGAMILGDKQSLSLDLKDKLNRIGLRHIVAISGMHIIIIITGLSEILILFGLWRNQAFYFALIGIIIFILMIGAPPSAVRAGLMGILCLLAQKLGRLNQAWRSVIFVAVVILIFNPLLLKYDVGFQLSFAAVLGIIYFKPWFDKILLSRFHSKILTLLSMSLAAQITTLPILIYNFSKISLVAPLTNILVVGFLPIVMGFGFLGAFFGIFWTLLGQIFVWPSSLLLNYIMKIVDFFSSLSLASLEIKNIHWLWLAVYYLFLFILYLKIREKPLVKQIK